MTIMELNLRCSLRICLPGSGKPDAPMISMTIIGPNTVVTLGLRFAVCEKNDAMTLVIKLESFNNS